MATIAAPAAASRRSTSPTTPKDDAAQPVEQANVVMEKPTAMEADENENELLVKSPLDATPEATADLVVKDFTLSIEEDSKKATETATKQPVENIEIGTKEPMDGIETATKQPTEQLQVSEDVKDPEAGDGCPGDTGPSGGTLCEAGCQGDGVAGGVSVPMISTAMEQEEKQLHQQSLQEEQRMMKEHEQDCNDEDREKRYAKLKYLLNKSTLYTTYLKGRMESQKLEEEQRLERRQKRAAKEAEKLRQAQEKEKKEKDAAAAAAAEVKTRAGVLSDVGNTSVSSSPARRATRKSARGATDRDSQESPEPRKRGAKRKADGDLGKSPKISDFFGGLHLASKRRKTTTGEEEKDAAAADVKMEESTPSTNEAESIPTEIDTEPLPSLPKAGRYFEGQPVPILQPTMFSGGLLRQYQVDGFMWMKSLYENGINGILADEMGLGKTIQCIALVSHLMDNNIGGPFLVVAPLSTVPNWVSEFMRFAPEVPVVLYHGTKDERHLLRRKLRKKYPLRPGIYSCPVVITSYEIAMNDRAHISNFNWNLLIVDEGHRIKNCQCRLMKELKMYRSSHRLLLSGTPLQNNLSELWSLLNFLLPEIFDDLGSFEAWFDLAMLDTEEAHQSIVQEEQQNHILSMLHQILTPFVLRRLKSDIDVLIPPKREILVYAPLSQRQQQFYAAIADRTIRKLVGQEEDAKPPEMDDKGRPVRKSRRSGLSYSMYLDVDESSTPTGKGKSKGKATGGKRRRSGRRKPGEDEDEVKVNKEDDDDDDVEKWVKAILERQDFQEEVKEEKVPEAIINIQLRNTMACLRRSCNHPYLIEYPLTAAGEYLMDEDLIRSSGKLMMIDQMLKELKRKGHKVLIFSQMTQLLDILEDYCYLRQYKYSRLDGSMHISDRRDQIDYFSKDKDIFVFLLSTRAGGLGINLTAADTVIIFDSDWNPQSDLQAQDRCHRIGQTKPVMVYRLVSANTVDQKIVERATAKRKLEKMVIHRGKFKSGTMEKLPESGTTISSKELLELLRESDYHSVVRGQDAQVISDAQLARLLDRSDLYAKWSSATGKTLHASSEPTEVKTETVKDVDGLFKIIDDDPGVADGLNTIREQKTEASGREDKDHISEQKTEASGREDKDHISEQKTEASGREDKDHISDKKTEASGGEDKDHISEQKTEASGGEDKDLSNEEKTEASGGEAGAS